MPEPVCPRLVDYLCIVGSNVPGERVPRLLARSPATDHPAAPLPPDIAFFCQPDGVVWSGRRRSEQRAETSFVFSLTDKDSGLTRYGVCLNFYRGVERGRGPGPGEGRARRGKLNTETSCDSAFYRSGRQIIFNSIKQTFS